MSDSMIIRSIFRDYSVHFISDFAPVLNSFADKHAFFIIDARVWRIFGDRIQNEIPGDRLLIVEASESNKSLDKCREIIEILVDKNVRRNEKLVAIGGGI